MAVVGICKNCRAAVKAEASIAWAFEGVMACSLCGGEVIFAGGRVCVNCPEE
jgi:hypothetical protein